MLELRRRCLLHALRAYADHSRISTACCMFSDHAEVEDNAGEAKDDTELEVSLWTYAADVPWSERYGSRKREGWV